MPQIDILSFISTLMFIALIGGFISIWRGIVTIRESRKSRYYRLRRNKLLYGWRLVLRSFWLLALAIFLQVFGEPTAYRYFDITPTMTLSPTITPIPTGTISPTVTLSPTITLTPEFTNTPTATLTPHIPLVIEIQFEGNVTPPAEAAFSLPIFSTSIDALLKPIRPNTLFTNPVGQIFGNFSYANMADGVQWTSLWYRNGELVFYETLIWNGGSGGLGYTDWHPEPEEWLPGNYQVQIFTGLELKIIGEFIVEGDAVTATPTPTVTLTPTDTSTPTLSPTPHPTQTRTPVTPSITPQPTQTRTMTPTRQPTSTHTPATPSITPQPTQTRTPTPGA